MKTTSGEVYYAISKSIFASWDILEHDLRRVKFLLGMKPTSSAGFFVTFKCIFNFRDILEPVLKGGWSFC